MIGRMHHVVLDCPAPDILAAFYSALLGLPVTYRDDDWVVVAASDTSSGRAFQRAPAPRPPPCPVLPVPHQLHRASTREDPAAAGPRRRALAPVRPAGRQCEHHR